MRTIFQDPFAEESLSVNSFRIDADKIFYWGEIESYSEAVSGEDGPLEIEGTKYIYAVVDNDDFLLVLFRTEDHCTYIDSNPKDSWDIIDIDAHNLIGNVIDDIEDDECSPEKRNYVFLIDNSGNPVINMKKLNEIGFVPKEQRKKLLWPEKLTDIQEQDNRKKRMRTGNYQRLILSMRVTSLMSQKIMVTGSKSSLKLNLSLSGKVMRSYDP